MRLYRLTISLLLLTNVCFADDVVVDFSERSLPVLNEELRQLRASVNKIETLTTSYIPRTGLTAADFTSFTGDGNWHDLDMSSIVSADAVAVNLQIGYFISAGATPLQLRPKGATGAADSQYMTPNVGYEHAVISLGTDKIIEYSTGGAVTISLCLIIVHGYFE